MDPMPAGSKADQLLAKAKAKPISDCGSASMKAY